jgi:hypothetical protein
MNVAHTETSALRVERGSRTERALRPPVAAAWEFDDGFDFPPTGHPGRELFTASVFVLLTLSLLVWGGWKLISLM